MIRKARDVARELPLTNVNGAADTITLDRLRIVEWLRDCSGSHIQLLADELEKEIREAGQ